MRFRVCVGGDRETAGRWKENGESASRMEKSSLFAKDHHGTIFRRELNRGSMSGLLVKKGLSANLSSKQVCFYTTLFHLCAGGGVGAAVALNQECAVAEEFGSLFTGGFALLSGNTDLLHNFVVLL